MENIDYTNDDDNNKNKFKISSKFILLIFFVIILSTVLFFIFYLKYKQMKSYIETDRIYNNIFINGIDVGNMTYDEAMNNIIDKFLLTQKSKKIILVFGNDFNEYSFEDFRPMVDVEEAVKFAFNYAKEGTLNDRYIKVKHLNDKPLKIEVNYSFDICNIKKVVLELSSKYDKNPINAVMIKKKMIL